MLYQLTHVTYRYILDIPEMTIPEESVTCIYGESGAGKTTLLRLLNMLISPDKGTVFFQGEDISQMDPVTLRRRAVMLPQEPLVFPGNIRENLLIGLRFSEKASASDGELSAALDTASLDKTLDTDASILSGGEKQRLALARVLLLDPEVLLLDEPSASLDDHTEQTVIDNALSYAKQKKKAIVLVSHGKHIVERYGDYAIELSNGRIIRGESGGKR